MLWMIEPLLTSCQKGPSPPSLPRERSVGSGLGNSRAFVFQFVWRGQTLSSSWKKGGKAEKMTERERERLARKESFCVKFKTG